MGWKLEKSKGFVVNKGVVSLEDIISSIKSNKDFSKAGDIIVFTGTVRESSIVSDKDVARIEIQAVEDLADRQLDEICHKLIEEFDLIDARVVHYIGFFDVGEELVHCVIASKHRKEGFKAIIKMIEEYKHKAYIFKCEVYNDKSTQWISTANEVK
ncbi:MAG: molybdopterin synthase catalytic subunit [Candidatus Hodarchaeales archaeon]